MQEKLSPKQVTGAAAEQHSEAWSQWRKQFRSASEAATVLGINPHEHVTLMKKRALGLMPPKKKNYAMRMGLLREEEVREKAEAYFGFALSPQCWEYGTYAASLDGIDATGKIVVELKVSKHAYYEIRDGKIPENYKVQVMQQLLCTGAETGYLVSMNPHTGKIEVSDPITLEEDFYDRLEAAWAAYEKLEVK